LTNNLKPVVIKNEVMKKLGLIASHLSIASYLFVSQAFAQPVNINIDDQVPDEFVQIENVGINEVIRFILIVLIAVAVLASIIFLVWGGIKWITSGGDKTKVDAARSTIVAAVIGLIVTLLAFVILNVVVNILGVGNTIFDICIPTLGQANC
jgi:hypothetical protein